MSHTLSVNDFVRYPGTHVRVWTDYDECMMHGDPLLIINSPTTIFQILDVVSHDGRIVILRLIGNDKYYTWAYADSLSKISNIEALSLSC